MEGSSDILDEYELESIGLNRDLNFKKFRFYEKKCFFFLKIRIKVGEMNSTTFVTSLCHNLTFDSFELKSFFVYVSRSLAYGN